MKFKWMSFGLSILIATQIFAINPFTLVEDGYPEGKGVAEFENTFEFDYHLGSDHAYKNISAEHEIEYGFSDDLVLRIAGSYFYEDAKDSSAGMHFDVFKLEGQYYFSNPNIDQIGISTIGAVEIGEHALSLTGIAIFQKDWEKWTVNYNLGFTLNIDGVFETGGTSTTEGVITNGFGACYAIDNTLRVGANITAETHYDNLSDYTGTTVWVGPTIDWVPNSSFWVTAGPSFQVTNHAEEPDFLFKVVIGYYF